jgi:predicted protein tyrosine phosphatase/rubrerythrin
MDLRNPCNEAERHRLNKGRFPNPGAIPSPAFLVIGAKPSEYPDNRRDFYRNPAYYTYDFIEGEVGPRHIVASFNDVDVNRELAILYCQKFDVIIFDFSTDKYRNGNPAIIDFLLSMLKPGGSFITEFETAAIDLSVLGGRTNGSTPEEFVKKLRKEKAVKSSSAFERVGFLKRLLSVDSLIAENPVARTVYTEGFRYRDEPTCMVLTKQGRLSPEEEEYHRQLALAFEANAREQQKGKWDCPVCSFKNEAGAKVCKICGTGRPNEDGGGGGGGGAPAPPEAPAMWRCPVCGLDNPEGSPACGACGFNPKMTPQEFIQQFPRPATTVEEARAIFGSYLDERDYFAAVTKVQGEVRGKVSLTEIVSPVKGRGGLFQGNATAAATPEVLVANNIGLIVQASADPAPKALIRDAIGTMGHRAPFILELDMRDTGNDSLAAAEEKRLQYEPHGMLQLLALMRTVRNDGRSVLVNCSVGVSRSTSVVLMHLMDPEGENMPLLDAFRFLKMKRPIVIPNYGLLHELIAFEKRTRGGSTTISQAVLKLHPEAKFQGGGKKRRKTRKLKKTRKSKKTKSRR